MRNPEEELVEIGVEVDSGSEVDTSLGSAEQELKILVSEGDIEGVLENSAYQKKSEEVQIDLAMQTLDIRESKVTNQMYTLYREGGIYDRAATLANQRSVDIRRAKLEMLRIYYENKTTSRLNPQNKKAA